MQTLPNTMSAEVYITSMDSVVWSFDIDRVPGLIRNGSNKKIRRVCGVKYQFPDDENYEQFIKGYVVIGGTKVGVETTDGGISWEVMYNKREI